MVDIFAQGKLDLTDREHFKEVTFEDLKQIAAANNVSMEGPEFNLLKAPYVTAILSKVNTNSSKFDVA